MAETNQSLAVDMSELELYSEAPVIDPNAVYGAFTLPPEFDSEGKDIKFMVIPKPSLDKDGKWIKAKPPKDNKDAPRNTWNLTASVDWVIEAEGMPWNHTSLRDWPSTRVYNGTSSVDAILKAYTGSAGVGMTNGQKMQKFVQFVEAGKALRVTLQWEATEVATQEEKDAGEFKNPFLRGMRNFPSTKLSDGSVSYQELTEKDGKTVRTQARVKQYWPL